MNKLIDTFKQTADRIAFLDRGYGINQPDVQSAIEAIHKQVSLKSPTLEIISAKDFGVKGDGVTDDSAAINNLLASEYRTIYFPPGKYLVKNTVTISNQSDKHIIFHPASVIAQKVDSGRHNIIDIINCNNVVFTNLSINDEWGPEGGNKGSLRGINVSNSHYCRFDGTTNIFFTRSISFMFNDNCSYIDIDTIISHHERNANALWISDGYGYTINKVIAYGGRDDIVVLKSLKGPCHDVTINMIQASLPDGRNAAVAFSIGTEILEGDIYNIHVGSIVAKNVIRGVYIKTHTGETTGHANPERKVYNVSIDHVKIVGTIQDYDRVTSGAVYIVSKETEYMHNLRDIYIGNVEARGYFMAPVIYLEMAKNITIGNVNIDLPPHPGPEVVSTALQINREGVRIEKGSSYCKILGGFISCAGRPIRIYQPHIDDGVIYSCDNNQFKNLTLQTIDTNGNPSALGDLINIYLTNKNNIVENCDFIESDWHVRLSTDSASATNIIRNCYNRHFTRSGPPNKGVFYKGERIINTNPANENTISEWIVTQRGAVANKTWSPEVTFFPSDWVKDPDSNKVYICITENENIHPSNQPDYEEGNTYNPGDIVKHDSVIYRCKEQTTSRPNPGPAYNHSHYPQEYPWEPIWVDTGETSLAIFKPVLVDNPES